MPDQPNVPPATAGSIMNRPFQPTVEPAKFPPIYTNFVHVAGAPEEIIFDFGLQVDPTGSPASSVKLSHRLVMSYYTAKRLAIALEACLARQEATFGQVETDVARRVAAHTNK